MIVKQKNLRVFHINVDSKEEFLDYFSKNKIILMEFFLLIDGQVDADIKTTLEKSGICFKDISGCNLKLSNVKKEVEVCFQESKQELKEEIVDNTPKEKIRMYERPIRSGEEIHEDLPVVIFGRINSGAKLFSSQSVSIYGIIDGLVQCDGEYIVLNGIGASGNLIFNGEIIDKDILKENMLQKITCKNNIIEIKEI